MAYNCEIISATPDGITIPAGTYYLFVIGAYDYSTTEATKRVLVRGSYTWSSLRCYVKSNGAGTATVIKSRINAVDGTQVLSIPAATTGEFKDTTHSDALVNGNLICWSYVRGSDVNITNMNSLLNSASNIPIEAITGVINFETKWGAIDGGNTGMTAAGESDVQYTARTGGTYSNLAVYIASAAPNAGTVKFRKNTADGNQLVSIPNAGSGWYEDAVNTDVVAAGDVIDVAGASAGTMSCTVIQTKLTSANRIMITGYDLSVYLWTTCYLPAEGNLDFYCTVEARAQTPPFVATKRSKLFVRIKSSSTTVATTFKSRKNSANGNMSVSMGAGATGVFEDLVNTDSLIATDLFGTIFNYAGAAGLSPTLIGYTDGEPPALPASKPMGNIAAKLVAAGAI
ncbi:MAG: hypothetical protein Q7R57_06650 [Dehalococcoidales bacterium]|nr:hypothetical protein [Dehalococcoidales bacterium]